jgi:hypothetical protein
MPAKIRTTGELREFLCDTLSALRNGVCEPEVASGVTKLATQINESFYAEVKVNRARSEMGECVDKFGALGIGTTGEING